MVRYFYTWTPLLIVGAVFILSLPWLGLIALMLVALVVVPAIVAGLVLVPYLVGRAIGRRWHAHAEATPRPATAPPVAARQPALRKGHAS